MDNKHHPIKIGFEISDAPQVSLWTPNIKEPVLKYLAHSAPVAALDVYRDYCVSAGGDGRTKIFDLRKADEPLHSFCQYGRPVRSIDVSMTGLVSLAAGPRVQVYAKEMFSGSSSSSFDGSETRTRINPYLQQEYNGRDVGCVRFQPYQDVLSVGMSGAIGSMIVPGAAVANFDSYEANPYETTKQKQESQVKGLLEKLSADMITFNLAGRRGPLRSGSVVGILKWVYRSMFGSCLDQELGCEDFGKRIAHPVSTFGVQNPGGRA